MTTAVEVTISIPIINPKVRLQLEEKFNSIHDQKFKQRVNFSKEKPNGEILEMEHSKFSWIDAQTFFIPCHWSYEHAIQTQKDIKKVLTEFGKVSYKTRISY